MSIQILFWRDTVVWICPRATALASILMSYEDGNSEVRECSFSKLGTREPLGYSNVNESWVKGYIRAQTYMLQSISSRPALSTYFVTILSWDCHLIAGHLSGRLFGMSSYVPTLLYLRDYYIWCRLRGMLCQCSSFHEDLASTAGLCVSLDQGWR